MRVLLACEESQACCTEFRRLGHEAYSCDILEASGEHPEWHVKADVRLVLNEEPWDLVVAFPPCTDLCVSGARWWPEKQANGSQRRSEEFFMEFVTYAENTCVKVAIENPIGRMSSVYRKPDQIIQPWQFGHGETKATCLWLHNGLPLLVPTEVVEGREHRIHKMPPGKDRGKERSKTYAGVARAMAEQWGGKLNG